MTEQWLKNMMDIASANGDMKHYKKLERKLKELENKKNDPNISKL